MNTINLTNKLNHFFLLCALFIIFLNPYFAGPLSIISGQIFILCFIAFFFFKIYILEKSTFFINYKFLITVLILIIYPNMISFVTGTQVDLGMINMNINVLAMIIFGFSIMHTFKNLQESTKLPLYLCKFFTTVIVLNSVIVLTEFYFPPFRVLLESLLIPDGRVDYTNGFRFRGFASAGGASLSVAHGIGIALMYYLFRKNCFGPFRLLLSVTIVFISLIFIGRTGFVVAFVGVFLVAILTKPSQEKAKLLSKAWVYIILIGCISLLSYATVFFDSLPAFYQNYSINVFLGGAESLKSEGTITAVINFFSFPDNIWQILFGIGNMSGGYEDGMPADPGLMKILTGYGVLGLLLYPGILLWCFSLPKGYLRDILIIVSILLVCTEFKEPFILKGYTSRFFWLLIGLTAYHRGLFAVRRLVKL
jgi:hypothetical protein